MILQNAYPPAVRSGDMCFGKMLWQVEMMSDWLFLALYFVSCLSTRFYIVLAHIIYLILFSRNIKNTIKKQLHIKRQLAQKSIPVLSNLHIDKQKYMCYNKKQFNLRIKVN